MTKILLISLITIVVFSTVVPVHASITTKATVDDNLSIVYDFEDLDQAVYDKVVTEFSAEIVPQAIKRNLELENRTDVQYSFGSQPLVFDNDTRTIQVSFFLNGSDIISSTTDRTTMKRTYEVRTDWRKFRLNLTSDFSIDFAERLVTPLSEWQKTSTTTFYYENKQSGAADIFFYLTLPASASNIQVQGDTVFYDLSPSLAEQLLNSPFLILGVLAVALVVVLIYRKVR